MTTSVEGQVTIKKHAGYTEKELQDYLDGKTPWPHVDLMPLSKAANYIASSYHEMWRGRYRPDPKNNATVWAAYFPQRTQGGGLTGSFVCLYYGSDGGMAAEVTVCKHDKASGANANHQRGWHPGYCKLCGLDMTVDSGD